MKEESGSPVFEAERLLNLLLRVDRPAIHVPVVFQ